MPEENAHCPYHSDPSTSIGKDFSPLWGPQLDNPYPFYAMARKQEPIFFSPFLQTWVVTRYEDIKAILRDPKRFSSAFVERLMAFYTPETLSVLNQGISTAALLTLSDPPAHTRGRELLAKALSARRVASLEPAIRQIATTSLEQLLPLGQADFVTQFAAPFPLSVLLHLLGLPEDDLLQVRKWAEDGIALVSSFLPPEQQLSCAKSNVAFHQYLQAILEQRRLDPGDDFISDLLVAMAKEQLQLSPEELLGTLLTLVTVGVTSVTDILSNCVYQLLTQQRQHWAALQQEPDLIPSIAEEMLRLDSSVPGTFRLTTQEVEVGGMVLPKDALIFVALYSANHDEALFDKPEVFDPSRANLREHMAFGYGIHFCIGASLARLQLRVVLECLSQLPSLRLVSDEPLQYHPSMSLRGPEHLLIQWDRPL
jgi:cytochrome P450